MDDELNIDPRETDYLDHIDMNQAINFYELRTQLADLGFNEDALLDQLRRMVAGDQLLHDIDTTVIQGQDKVYFGLSYEKPTATSFIASTRLWINRISRTTRLCNISSPMYR